MTTQTNKTVSILQAVQKFIYYDAFGPKLLRFRDVINVFKGLTWLWVYFLMRHFNNYSTGMWLYMALHGSYGFFWVAKDIISPDATFNHKQTIVSSLFTACFLILYWSIPIPLAMGYSINEPSTARIIYLVAQYVTGLFLMVGSDYYKFQILKKRKGLINSGFFKLTRNPNYLGEIMIYSSFALCAQNLVGVLVIVGLQGLLFATNMYLKDKTSLEKKKGWEEYEKQSYLLLPKLLPTWPLNGVLYGIVFALIGSFLMQQHPASFWKPLCDC